MAEYEFVKKNENAYGEVKSYTIKTVETGESNDYTTKDVTNLLRSGNTITGLFIDRYGRIRTKALRDGKVIRPETKKDKIEKLEKEIAIIEKLPKTRDNIDKIIIKRRELCKLKGTDYSQNNIWTTVHRSSKNGHVERF